MLLSASVAVAMAESASAAPTEPAPAAAPTALNAVPLVPAQGALLGHYYDENEQPAQVDKQIGRKPPVHLQYFYLEEDWVKAAKADFADGRTPLVNWEPFKSDGETKISFDDILSGKFDTVIKKRADDAKALNKPFFLDFAAEMNGDEAWGEHDPAKYIAVWRHVHDIFTARKATNVVWVWCPNNETVEGTPEPMKYYPGDAYVDWTGVDGYNWGTSDPDFEWQSFEQVFAGIYPELAAKNKPIIIGEMASDEVGGSKATWIKNIVPTLKNKFPAIKAFVWFDTDKERHWNIDSSSSSLKAYQDMVKDPYLNP